MKKTISIIFIFVFLASWGFYLAWYRGLSVRIENASSQKMILKKLVIGGVSRKILSDPVKLPNGELAFGAYDNFLSNEIELQFDGDYKLICNAGGKSILDGCDLLNIKIYSDDKMKCHCDNWNSESD